MNSIIDIEPLLNSYQSALIALLILCLCVLIQSFLTAPLAFLKQEQSPGMPLNGDHKLFSFRVLRTHNNSVESLAPFAISLIIAIVIGVQDTAVNWLAMIHVAFRLLFWAVYYSGIGKVAGGIRTLCFVGGLLANIALVLLTIIALY